MTRRVILMLAVVSVTSPAISAQESNMLTGGALPVEQPRWQHFDLDMSPGDYEAAYRQNRRLVRHMASDTLSSLGLPDTAVNMVGSAVALSISKAKISLNKSDTLGLELKELIDSERQVLLRYKVDW